MADPNENIRNGKKDLNEISAIVGALDDGFQSLTSRLTDLAEGLSNIVDDARAFSRVQKDTISTLNKLAKTNEKLIKNQIDLNNGQLSSKKINEQINEITATREVLNQRLNNLLEKQTQGLKLSVNELDEITNLQEGIAEITEEVADNYKNQLNFAKEIEKKAGGFQKLAGVVKSIPGLKGIAGPFQDAADSAAKAAASGKSTFQIFKAGAGGLTSFLKGPIWITALFKVAKFFIDAMFEADKRVTNIAKNLAISKEEAQGVYNSFKLTKDKIDSTYNTTTNVNDAFSELVDLSEFVVNATESQINAQIILTKNLGLTKEQALGVQEAFASSNIDATKGLDIVRDQIATFANRNKLITTEKKLYEDISKTSKLIQINFRGNISNLAKTTLEAKKLGLTLDQVAKTGASLLDFESSISAQIEAELLTGKQINLEKARLFALNNDIAGLTEEISKQGITQASFAEMNAIQQDAIAKSLGMSANEMADMLYKQEVIQKTAGNYTKQLREQARMTNDINLMNKADAIEKGILQGKDFEASKNAVEAQVKFEQSLERVKEIFSDLATVGGPLDVLANAVKQIADDLSKGEGFLSMILGVKGTTPKAMVRETAYSSPTMGTGLGFDIADKLGMFNNTLNKKEITADDFIIKTHPKDTLVMAGGTKLGNNDETLKMQQETNALLRQLVSKSTDISLNGERLTNGLAKQTYALGS